MIRNVVSFVQQRLLFCMVPNQLYTLGPLHIDGKFMFTLVFRHVRGILQLSCPRVLWNGVPRGSPDDGPLEECGHGFQRHALGLGHAKDCVDCHEDAKGTEEQKRAVCGSGEQHGGDAGDDAVEGPLAHQSRGHDQ